MPAQYRWTDDRLDDLRWLLSGDGGGVPKRDVGLVADVLRCTPDDVLRGYAKLKDPGGRSIRLKAS